MSDIGHNDWCNRKPDDGDDGLCRECRQRFEAEARYYYAEYQGAKAAGLIPDRDFDPMDGYDRGDPKRISLRRDRE